MEQTPRAEEFIETFLKGIPAYDFEGRSLSPIDLALELLDDTEYIRHKITMPNDPDIEIDGLPGHWYMLINSFSQPGVADIEFGITMPRPGDMKGENSHIENELQVNEVIKHTEDKITENLYRLIGGMMVRQARKAGSNIFAAIELKYGFPDETHMAIWSEIVFHKSLTNTADVFKRWKNTRQTEYRKWEKEIIDPRNKDLIAQKMALSGLRTARKLPTTEV
jgi:hypothetical protein